MGISAAANTNVEGVTANIPWAANQKILTKRERGDDTVVESRLIARQSIGDGEG